MINYLLAMGIVYIIDIALAAMGIGTLLILAINRFISLKQGMRAALMTNVCILLLSLLYFIIDYYSLLMHNDGWVAAVRVLDIWLGIGLNFSVLSFTRHTMFTEKAQPYWCAACCCYGAVFLAALINYGFLIDGDYHAKADSFRGLAVGIQYGQTILLMLLYLICIIAILLRQMSKSTAQEMRPKALIMLLLAALTGAQNSYFAICSLREISNEGYLHTDLTALIHLSLSVFVLWYAIRYGFVDLYQKRYEKGDSAREKKTARQVLLEIAEEAELTTRETEIIELLYDGATYQRIADELFISKNTVKHHVSSVYRKTGIASKMDLITKVRTEQQN